MRVVLAAAVASSVAGAAWMWPSDRTYGAGTCGATVVHYTPTRIGLPHADAGGASANLGYYTGATLMDGRINGSDGLVIYAGGRNGNVATKILWTIPTGAGRVLRIAGRRLDGEGTFVERWPAVRKGRFPSIVNVPDAGCWRLSLASGKTKTSIVLQAIEARAAQSCHAAPVYRREPRHPRFGAVEWMPASPLVVFRVVPATS